MLAEWAPHERTWMAWPTAGYALGDTPEVAETASTPVVQGRREAVREKAQ